MNVYEALAEPNRRRILAMLCERDRSAGEMVRALSVSQPGVSKHLRILREAGLVTVRSEAQRRVYRLRPEPLGEVDEWLKPYRKFWSGRLDALETHLEKEAGDA
jgi:DNA-binding transcriptional ArsR family regulator